MSEDIMKLVKDQTKKLVRFGKTESEIVSAISSKYDEMSDSTIKSAVKAVLNTIENYRYIQKIIRSDLVLDSSGIKTYVLDPVTRTRSETTLSNLTMLFDPKFDIRSRVKQCTFVYDPFKLEQIYEPTYGSVYYNTYQPPNWQSDAFYNKVKIPITEKLPEIYSKFLDHLLDNDSESKGYVLDWLANAIQDRNYCILTTIGSQGIGKGVLGDVMRMLVGDNNYSKTGNRLLEGKFNSQIKNKRIVYCDEVSIKTHREEEKLKDLINSIVEVELKGKDAELTTNFASFYFSSNSIDAIKLYADDRRFSIVNLTSKKLSEIMSKDEIGRLLDPESIAELGRYLFCRPIDSSKMLTVFKSARTEEVRSASLAMWHDWFLDEYAMDHKGKVVKLQDAGDAVEDKFGSKIRPGRPAFMDLQSRFPNKYKVAKKTLEGKQVWCILFAE
jgi:hypothetical protein